MMTGQERAAPNETKQASQKWLALLTGLWIAGVLAMFFVVRIFGSSTVQNLLHKAGS